MEYVGKTFHAFTANTTVDETLSTMWEYVDFLNKNGSNKVSYYSGNLVLMAWDVASNMKRVEDTLSGKERKEMLEILKRNKEKDLNEQVRQEKQGLEELSEDILDQINGAGNPFEDIPRVPTQPIDNDLREKS